MSTKFVPGLPDPNKDDSKVLDSTEILGTINEESFAAFSGTVIKVEAGRSL